MLKLAVSFLFYCNIFEYQITKQRAIDINSVSEILKEISLHIRNTFR